MIERMEIEPVRRPDYPTPKSAAYYLALAASSLAVAMEHERNGNGAGMRNSLTRVEDYVQRARAASVRS